MTADTRADRFVAECLCIWIHCVSWEQRIVEMINSTWRCVRADAWLLAQRLIIMKHMLSLHVSEPHQLERGLCWTNPSRVFATRDECGLKQAWQALDTSVEYVATVWGHVRTEMIKVAATRIKSQTHTICYLSLFTKGQLFCEEQNKHSWKNIKCVYAGWCQLFTADWIHVVCF